MWLIFYFSEILKAYFVHVSRKWKLLRTWFFKKSLKSKELIDLKLNVIFPLIWYMIENLNQ